MSAQRQPLLRQHVNSKNFEKVCAAIGSEVLVILESVNLIGLENQALCFP